SSRRRHTRFSRDWSSDVCSSDLGWLRPTARGQRDAANPKAIRPVEKHHPQRLSSNKQQKPKGFFAMNQPHQDGCGQQQGASATQPIQKLSVPSRNITRSDCRATNNKSQRAFLL